MDGSRKGVREKEERYWRRYTRDKIHYIPCIRPFVIPSSLYGRELDRDGWTVRQKDGGSRLNELRSSEYAVKNLLAVDSLRYFKCWWAIIETVRCCSFHRQRRSRPPKHCMTLGPRLFLQCPLKASFIGAIKLSVIVDQQPVGFWWAKWNSFELTVKWCKPILQGYICHGRILSLTFLTTSICSGRKEAVN